MGDFNDNGVDDLAVGVPGEITGDGTNHGGVTVVYGFEQSGLATVAAEHWSHVDSDSEFEQEFDGSTVAAGNFDGLEGDDLAFASTLGQSDQTVTVFFGTQAAGVQEVGTTQFTFSTSGAQLAVGDIDSDGLDDLVMGYPAGTLGVLGGILRIAIDNLGTFEPIGQLFQTLTTNETDEAGDEFGGGLTMGDFNGDGHDDLAVGAPGEMLIGGGNDHGVVMVFDGLSPCCFDLPEQFWRSDYLSGVVEDGDRYGQTMTAGDYNGDGVDDLVIAAPFESVGSEDAAGEITIVFGAIGIFADGFETGDATQWQ